jgi:glycosyl hydrolase family 59 (putative galactocerebrosidase)
MRMHLFGILVAIIGGTLMTGTADAQKSVTQVDIAAMQPGPEPPGFTFWRTGQGAAAEWRVVADPTATAQKAIAQTSTDRTDYRFPLAVYQPVSAKNVDVTVRFKPVAGKVDEAGGIAVRLTTSDDYYVVRANALEDNVNFYRVVKGRRSQIKGANTKVTGNQWHTLGLRADGNKFTISFDGKPLFTAEDKTFADAGKVALWTKADSVTHFDAISITPLD